MLGLVVLDCNDIFISALSFEMKFHSTWIFPLILMKNYSCNYNQEEIFFYIISCMSHGVHRPISHQEYLYRIT